MSLFICRYLHVFSADRLSHGTPVFVQWNQIVAIGVGRVEHHLIRASVWWCQQSNYSGIAALQSKGQNIFQGRPHHYVLLFSRARRELDHLAFGGGKLAMVKMNNFACQWHGHPLPMATPVFWGYLGSKGLGVSTLRSFNASDSPTWCSSTDFN